MKKIILLASVAFVALSLSSCKKEWTCECTVSSTYAGTTTTETVSGKTDKMSKKDAKDKCNEGDSSYDLLGVKVSSDCEIK